MKKRLLTLMILMTGLSHAQSISLNDVNAYIGNVPGRLFQKPLGGSSTSGYEVPKNSGKHTIFATSLWCAALDDTGGLHLAAMRFGQVGNDFFAGPYSSTNSYTNTNYVSNYSSSTWFVSKLEIQNHLANYWQAGYVMTANIANWPGNGVSGLGVASNLAPFVDNNNNGVYEPMLGEYPDIRGDEACYMIMNDAAGVHTETGGLPLGVEIHTMLYQYATADYQNRTTYLNYRVFNRGVNNYSDFKVSLWSDFDLGNAIDDFMGCDVTNNMMYVYNGDNDDGVAASMYGTNPPAAGIVALNKNMDYFTYFTNGASFPYTDPSAPAQYYNYMQGLWANGQTMYYGGTGTTGTIPAKYMFPGDSDPFHTGTGGVDPGFDWDEISAMNPTGDRRGVMTVETVNLPAGADECYDFAVLYARETGNNNLQNLAALRTQAALAKSDFDAMTSYNCNQITLGMEQLNETQIGLYPNPTTSHFTLSFGNELLTGKIVITDINGRVIYNEDIKNENVKTILLDTKPGVYNVSIKTDLNTIHKRLIITE